jgi:uncharacterized protein YqhQ
MAKLHRTMIGGQAVIEGVMMRGPRSTAMAVRAPDGGIALSTWDNPAAGGKKSPLSWPLIRGVVNFAEMLRLGFRCLDESAKMAGLDDGEEEPNALEKKFTEVFGPKAMGALTGFSAFLGVALAVLLFMVLPSYLVSVTDRFVHYGAMKTLMEGFLKILFFVLYLVLISRMKDIRRVFEYHGAEHKTIYCYENGDELTVENARRHSRFHPRCGTSFLLIVLIVSIVLFSFVTWSSVAVRVLLKLLLLPLVVGISYEIIKFAGRHDTSAMRFVLAPGLWLQRLTTREPDDSQLEVAIRSIQAVLTGNPADDAW